MYIHADSPRHTADRTSRYRFKRKWIQRIAIERNFALFFYKRLLEAFNDNPAHGATYCTAGEVDSQPLNPWVFLARIRFTKYLGYALQIYFVI